MYACGETLTRLRPATIYVDPYSNEPTDASWDEPDELPLLGCGFDPGASSEPTAVGRDSVVTQPTAYIEFGSDVLPGDRIRRELTGRIYAVDGEPGAYKNPFTGWEAGMVVKLKAAWG